MARVFGRRIQPAMACMSGLTPKILTIRLML
jgi:hypothetical protein